MYTLARRRGSPRNGYETQQGASAAGSPVDRDPWEGETVSDNMELLQQRVTKHQQKLDQASKVAQMSQERLDAVSKASDEADRERRRLQSALELAERRAKRLAKEAKNALKLADAVGQDRADAENELAENLQRQQKRQDKLARAEAELASAKAAQDVEQAAASKQSAPRKRPAAASTATRSKRPAARKTATKRTATKKTSAGR